MNSEIRGLQEGIIQLLNDSQLPVEVKRLCVYEIYNRLKEAGDQAVCMELRNLGNGRGREADQEGSVMGAGQEETEKEIAKAEEWGRREGEHGKQ